MEAIRSGGGLQMGLGVGVLFDLDLSGLCLAPLAIHSIIAWPVAVNPYLQTVKKIDTL